MADRFITTKYGTKINVTGLSTEQIAKVRSIAEDNGAYGAKGAALAKQLQQRNTAPKQPGSTAPGTTEQPPVSVTSPVATTDIGLKTGGEGAIDPAKATAAVLGAEERDSQNTFNMNNPGAQTDALGNSQVITVDPQTGQTKLVQQGGQLNQSAQNFLQGALGKNTNLDLSPEIQGIQGTQLDLSGAKQLAQSGNVDLSSQIAAISGNKLDLSSQPKILQSGDVRNEIGSVRDANYKYLTRNLAAAKKQEREELEQELAQRGIPFEPDNPNSKWSRTMKALDDKYQTLDDQANMQAIASGDASLQALVGAQSTAADSFVNSAKTSYDANSATAKDAASLKIAGGDQALKTSQALGNLATTEYDAATGKIKDVAALKGMETDSATQAIGTGLSAVGGTAGNFTPYAGGSVDQSSQLMNLIGTISDQQLTKLGIDKDTMIKLRSLAKPSGGGGGGSSSSGNGFGITIGGVAP